MLATFMQAAAFAGAIVVVVVVCFGVLFGLVVGLGFGRFRYGLDLNKTKHSELILTYWLLFCCKIDALFLVALLHFFQAVLCGHVRLCVKERLTSCSAECCDCSLLQISTTQAQVLGTILRLRLLHAGHCHWQRPT